MRTTIAMVTLAGSLLGCGHAKEAEVVSSVDIKATLGMYFTADTTRLISGVPTSAEGAKQLAAVMSSQLAVLGQLREPKVAGEQIDLVAELPAPGWALRVRLTEKPELMCLVAIEPIATQPADHPVDAAPWSVQDALEQMRRRAPTLEPARSPPMDAARFARLRAEATSAAAEGHDPPLTPSEFVRVPRPIRSDAGDRPYYVPPPESSSGILKN